ncbi:MAG: heparan-alpha-glucosaminide N-acetyltransferase [Patescibacteria group bacterium]
MNSTSTKNRPARFVEVDFLRGVAVLLMIVFHLIFDLNYLDLVKFTLDSFFWIAFERITATVFIFLVGVSLQLSYLRHQQAGELISFYKRNVVRAISLIFFALLITLVTRLYSPGSYIFFGVLHFIAVAILLALPLVRYHFANLILGLICLILGISLPLFLSEAILNYCSLIFWNENLNTLDYFPLLPWFGFVLLGIFFAKLAYKNFKRQFSFDFTWLQDNKIGACGALLGRNSLWIYLLHQPVIVGVLMVLSKK